MPCARHVKVKGYIRLLDEVKEKKLSNNSVCLAGVCDIIDNNNYESKIK